MSIALASDPLALGGARLWWLTDKDALLSDRGPLPGEPRFGEEPLRGLSPRRDRLLLYSDTELFLADAESGASRRLLRVERGGFERAHWPARGHLSVEIYWHERSGHPTDRGGFRERLHIESLRREGLAHRQGVAPPSASRGFFRKEALCSGTRGYAYREWEKGAYLYWWKPASRGGRRRLPEELGDFSSFRLLTRGRATFVCGVRDRKIGLFDVRGVRRSQRLTAPARVSDVAFHAGALHVAVPDRDPIALG